ncbi:MAG: asparagine synthetase B family protein [Phycisphaerales bacterium]
MSDRSRGRLNGSGLLGNLIPPGADEGPYRRTLQHALRPCPRCAALGKGTIAVVFNGCIYNHRDLRRELQAAGHEFSTDHSDTEVLVHGWGEWGACLRTRLESMHATLIWNSGQLYWMRDRFGEKPLYVADRTGSISAAASALAGLVRLRHQLGCTAPLLEDSFLRAWTQFGWNQTGPFSGINGAWIDGVGELGGDGLPVDTAPSLWTDVLNVDRRPLDEHEVDHTLRHAVHSRLEADVPLGCFLSGGIDSALVANYASELRPDLTTYTVRMPAGTFDESRVAARTAAHLGVRHEVLDCNTNLGADLVSLIQQLGLPFGDSSLLPTHWVSRAARDRVRVALTGDGGDELFMGYDRHRALPLLARLQRTDREFLDLVARLIPGGQRGRSFGARATRLLAAARFSGYKELVAIFTTNEAWKLGLAPQGHVGFGTIGHFGMTIAASADPDDQLWLDCARRFDLAFYLPEDLLRKSDTASMSCALEVRAPFLDAALSRACIAAETTSLMPRGREGGRKGLLRAVARKYLPADIVDRPKQGFAIPIGEWFRSDYGGLRQLLHDHLLRPEPFGPDHLGINSIINMSFVRQMLKEHDDAGTRSIWPWKGRDHSQRLYMLLVLSIWAKWLGKL